MQWLRRNFIAGFFVMVPVFISVAALVWLFNVVDGFTTPLYDRLLGRRIPGLGTVTTLVVKPFLYFVRRSGFAPFAWYRIALGIVLLVRAAGRT